MLFNSFLFIFLFFPLAFLGTYAINKFMEHRCAIIFLLTVSLFYYSCGEAGYLFLILSSIIFNYFMGILLSTEENNNGILSRKYILIFGIIVNLSLLAYFKYANFFIENVNAVFHLHSQTMNILLPLGISFYTFQQIAYLVDSYKERTAPYHFMDYALFVTFFPHLLAGPLVYHKEIIGQFKEENVFKFKPENIAEGFSMFCIGLIKKVILADGVAKYADIVYNYVGTGGQVSLIPAWFGVLAYTFQIYFDFSGYSDMAIGLARILGIRLPVNFNSPYKAVNIIDFWRRWNMTLSRFLKCYLYIALGGNRRGKVRRYLNLMLTMLLGGLWHGASWTFVFWGAIHGLYLCINHAWLALKSFVGLSNESNMVSRFFARAVTFFSVVIAWNFFRAKSFSDAIAMLKGMFLFNGITLPQKYHWLSAYPLFKYDDRLRYLVSGEKEFFFILFLFFIISLPRNSQQFISKYFLGAACSGEYLSREVAIKRVNLVWAVIFSFTFIVCLIFSFRPETFIYFKF